METITIKVEYPGPLDQELDKKIRAGMEAIGAKWIGQGMDLTTAVRDIVFDIER